MMLLQAIQHHFLLLAAIIGGFNFTTVVVVAQGGEGLASSLRGGGIKNNNNHSRRHRRTSTRIIGGTIAPTSRYTYYTSLRRILSGGTTGSHFCAGSLIAPQVILTAAHCADGTFAKQIRVVVGRPDFAVDGDGEEINVQRSVVHPMYTTVLDKAPNYDFALLYLERPVNNTNDHIKFLQLNQYTNVPVPGDILTVLGHGFTIVDKFSLSQQLKELNTFAISNKECKNNTINSTGWAYEDLVTDQMVCAEDSPNDNIEEDSCSGDSGGPLVMKGNDPNGADDIEVGVVSWGYKCAQEGYPGVYSRVSEAYDWLVEELCYNGSGDLAPDYFGCMKTVGSEVEEVVAETLSPFGRPSAMPSEITPTSSASPSASTADNIMETTTMSPSAMSSETTPTSSASPSASTTEIEKTFPPSAVVSSESPTSSASPSASPTDESTILIFSEITSSPTPAPVGVSSLVLTSFPTRSVSRLDPTLKQPTQDFNTMFPTSSEDV